MCSRFTQTEVGPLLRELLGPGIDDPPPRYNIAPAQEILVVRAMPSVGAMAARMRFGWPARHRTGGLLVNVRSETVSEKFPEAFARRRVVVPADGFYEWSGPPGHRRPWLIRRRDRRAFALAGLWAVSEPQGTPAFAILTTDPNEVVARVHDRMPVVLPLPACRSWLDPAAGHPDVPDWNRPPAAEDWEVVPVSRRVNRPDQDDAALWTPEPDDPLLL